MLFGRTTRRQPSPLRKKPAESGTSGTESARTGGREERLDVRGRRQIRTMLSRMTLVFESRIPAGPVG